MRFVMFVHSLRSDWNHGNAHFLRGVASELLSRGHEVRVYEPRDAWSLANLRAEHGDEPIRAFHDVYPSLRITEYALDSLDLTAALEGADVVLVHEWNDPELVHRVGAHRARRRGRNAYKLLFHDTHHRALTAPDEMARYDLKHYDGVLAFGRVLRDLYLARGWTRRAWAWHEAADTRVFRPLATQPPREGDVVWIGNWGDDERTAELREFLIDPVRAMRLKARIHGVRYPEDAKRQLREAGIEYAGWLPNFRVPEVFARFKLTLHVPRRPYVETLPGIPTIRVFEALASGIPLVCARWDDTEHLFTPGQDYLVARDGAEMKHHLCVLLDEPAYAEHVAQLGLETLLARHTCAHRVDELLAIVDELNAEPTKSRGTQPARPSELRENECPTV